MVLINKLALDEATVYSDNSSCWLRPVQAQTALPVMEERRRQVQQQLGQYGNHIGRFGREFVANTTELFEQVDALATVSFEYMHTRTRTSLCGEFQYYHACTRRRKTQYSRR